MPALQGAARPAEAPRVRRFSKNPSTPLACVAVGALLVAQTGLFLLRAVDSPLPASSGEAAAASLPFTVAWFAFAGWAALTTPKPGTESPVSRWTNVVGRVSLLAGLLFWGLWYSLLVL